MNYEKVLNAITEKYRAILKDNLVGIYVHGSIAMGCFNWNKSDIDYIAVVNENPKIEVKKEIMDATMKINEIAPKKGLEMHIVEKNVCKKFVYPTPFLLHYSNTHTKWYRNDPIDYCEHMNGVDKDLAAHFMIVKTYGITWFGETIESLFGQVSKENYLDSILFDIQEAENDIFTNPMYVILTLCRVVAFMKDQLIVSKKGGGQWGTKNLPDEYVKLVSQALQCYSSHDQIKFNPDEAKQYCHYMLDLIRSYKKE